MNKEKTITLDCNFSDNFINQLKQLSIIEEKKKYVVGIDCGNGKSIQVEGFFKPRLCLLYKRKKCGKKYKFYKTASFPLHEMEFIGERIVGDSNE